MHADLSCTHDESAPRAEFEGPPLVDGWLGVGSRSYITRLDVAGRYI